METQMESVRTWVLIVVTVLAVVALIAFARGSAHHRGRQIGANGVNVSVAASVSTMERGHV